MTHYKNEKDREKLPNVFNKQQLIEVFDCIDDPKTMIGSGLGFFCGLRISEVCNLQKRDLDLQNTRLKVVNGKGGKDAFCIIPPQFIEPLKLWVNFCEGNNSPYLFPTRINSKKHISKNELFRSYVKALKKAGLRKEVSTVKYENEYGCYHQPRYLYYFHTLRHSYATYLLEKGVDIAIVSRLMRHEQIDTTMIYTHISDKLKEKAISDAFDPFKNCHFQKSEYQTRREELLEERERQYMTEMSRPINMLQTKMINGEITPEEFKTRLEALKSMSNIIEVRPNAQQ